MRALPLALAALLFASGCSNAIRERPDTHRLKPDVELAGDHFRVVGQVQARVSCRNLFWIQVPDLVQMFFLGSTLPLPVLTVAIDDPALRERAYEELHTQHDLRGKPQLLHAIVEEWTLANYLGLFAVQRLTVSAEILELRESGP